MQHNPRYSLFIIALMACSACGSGQHSPTESDPAKSPDTLLQSEAQRLAANANDPSNVAEAQRSAAVAKERLRVAEAQRASAEAEAKAAADRLAKYETQQRFDARLATIFAQPDGGKNGAEIDSLLINLEHQRRDSCVGPWLYREYDCFRARSGEICGSEVQTVVKDFVEYEPCARPEFGIVGEVPVTVHNWPDAIDIQELDLHFHLDAQDAESWASKPEYKQKAMEQCKLAVDHVFSGRLDYTDRHIVCDDVWVSSVETNHYTKGRGLGRKRQTRLKAQWHARLVYYAFVYNTRTNDPLCPVKVVHHVPTEVSGSSTCRHESFGREPSNVCGSPERWALADSGVRRYELPLEIFDWRERGDADAICSTSDNLPVSNSVEAAIKLTALADNLEAMRSIASYNSLPWLLAVRERAQSMFEVTTATEASVDEPLRLYAKPDAPYGAGLSEDDQEMARKAMCTALAYGHVQTSRVVQAFSECLNHGMPSQSVARAARLYGAYVRNMRADGTLEKQKAVAYDMIEQMEAYANRSTAEISHQNRDEEVALWHAFLQQRLDDIQAEAVAVH